MQINIKDEFSKLKTVVIGIASDRGKKIHENNPKISNYLKKGLLPTEEILVQEVNNFAQTVESCGVEVLRPSNIKDQDQIFTRDIAFVISNKLIVSNMKKENRKIELLGIKNIIDQLDNVNIIYPPDNTNIEGGDVIIHGKYIFVGISSRTNIKGYEFLKNTFLDYEVIPFQLMVSDNPAINILHLDCTFQPFGGKYCLLYENGFIHFPTEIYDIFGENNIIKVNQFEMYHMNTNIFSVRPDLIISDVMFDRVNNIIKNLGIEIKEIPYQNVSKFGGLFRCSTLPLCRE
jgi:N-dimethylarginine dimethylaminohydrolase